MMTLCLSLLLTAAFAAPAEKPRLTLQMGHSDGISSLAITSDGRHLVTGSQDRTARLWDLETGDELRVFQGHGGKIVLTKDSKSFISTNWSKTPSLVSLDTGEELQTFAGHTDTVMGVALSPDGKTLATAGDDKTARLWDLETGRQLQRFEGHEGKLVGVRFSPDGRTVVSYGWDGAARLWEAATGRQLQVFKHDSFVVGVAGFSPRGTYLLTGGSDKFVRVWELATGREVRAIKGEADADSSSILISPDETSVISGGRGTARLWKLSTGRTIRAFEAPSDFGMSLAVSADWRVLATGNGPLDKKARLWDLATGKQLRDFKGSAAKVTAVAASPDGKSLFTASEDGLARLWSLSEGVEARRFKGHTSVASSLAVSPDGKTLLTGSWDETVRLWDPRNGAAVRSLEGLSTPVDTVAVTPDGLSAVAIGKKILRVWTLATGKKARSFDAVADPMSMAISPDGRSVAEGGWNGEIRLINIETGAGLWATKKTSSVHSLAFSRDGGSLVAGRSTGLAEVIDATTGKEVRAFNHGGGLFAVAFSLDGEQLVTAGPDGAKVWAFAAGRLLHAFRADGYTVDAAAFTPDGRRLVTGNSDGTTRLWDLDSGKELYRLISTEGGWVVVTPEGFFDGSPEGLKIVRWTVGTRSYPLEAFSEGYFTPGLLARLMAGAAAQPLSAPKLSEGFALPPSVRITSPASGSEEPEETLSVTVEAADQGGGIDEIRLFHNGKAVGAATRGMKAVKGTVRTQTFQVTLLEGQNTLRALALSRDRIEGNADEVSVTHAGARRQAALHLLGVGINRYKNPALNLNYALPDAKALLDFFSGSSKKLFSSVERRELFDAAATKTAILAELKALEGTPPQDVVVIYLAGHGESLENKWHFVPHELVYPDKEEDLKAKSLSSTELQDAVAKIGARKVLLLLDACKSGAALVAVRGFEDQKALRQLARASGVHIVAASARDQFASEVKELGHGIFTYTLLEGLGGKADAQEGFVTVRNLLAYVESRLPEVSEKYKAQAQFPVVDSRGMDFPISIAK